MYLLLLFFCTSYLFVICLYLLFICYLLGHLWLFYGQKQGAQRCRRGDIVKALSPTSLGHRSLPKKPRHIGTSEGFRGPNNGNA
jgi:hypothetical protein